ncbi:MAG: hypothetical protein U0931_16130 [Vulcanimicrobiota bacterium]
MDKVGGQSASALNYIVYTPPAAGSETQAQGLTPELWHGQIQQLVSLFDSAPGAPLEQPKPVSRPQHSWKKSPIPEVPHRHGKVLAHDTFLKLDQYPFLREKPEVEGAPHYREAGEGIHGVAQPTVDGIKAVLEKAGCGPGGSSKKPAIWTNLREEPVIYVNGQPLNLRSVKAPGFNQEHPGRTAAEVEKLEKQLKADILEEIKRNGNKLVVHDEEGSPPNVRVVPHEIEVKSVQTVEEVYTDLAKKGGYKVEFHRVPVTDTKKPTDQDIDDLVKSLKDADPEQPLIFNCHAGEGRTTTGMVLSSMLRRAKTGEEKSVLKDKALRADVKEQGEHNPRNYRGLLQCLKDAKKLSGGSQEEADQVIERYNKFHDLKKSVGKARKASETERLEDDRIENLQHAKDYLDRYHTILSFEQYAQDQAPDFKMTYSQWKKKHPEVEQNLERVQVALLNRQGASNLA